MKVFELMKLLGDLPANADVQCWNNSNNDIYGEVYSVSFGGEKADEAFVNIEFYQYED